MAIQYAGGTIYNNTFTGGTRLQIVAGIEAALTAAGWSTVSGGGTATVVMRSTATPTGNSIDVRLRDTGSGNCAQINMQNAAATRQSQSFFLLPGASKTFRVIANKYQFWCFTPGTSVARDVLNCGTLYVPSFLSALITGELGWISGNANSDSGTQVIGNWRTILACVSGGWGGSFNDSYMWSGLINSNLIDRNGTGNNESNCEMKFITQGSSRVQDAVNGYRWHDDSLLVYEPLLAWGAAATTDEAKIRGQVWDAVIVSDPFIADSTITLDGGTFFALTGSNSGSFDNARGTLFVKVA